MPRSPWLITSLMILPARFAAVTLDAISRIISGPDCDMADGSRICSALRAQLLNKSKAAASQRVFTGAKRHRWKKTTRVTRRGHGHVSGFSWSTFSYEGILTCYGEKTTEDEVWAISRRSKVTRQSLFTL